MKKTIKVKLHKKESKPLPFDYETDPEANLKLKLKADTSKISAIEQDILKQLNVRTKFCPTGHRVMIKKLTYEKAGDIILPDPGMAVQTRGIIVRIGLNCQGPWTVGDMVLFDTVSSRIIRDFEAGEIDDSLCLLHEDDIIASTNAPLRGPYIPKQPIN